MDVLLQDTVRQGMHPDELPFMSNSCPVVQVADSLSVCDTLRMADVAADTVQASDIFGASSFVPDITVVPSVASGDAIFSVMVVLLLLTYLLLVLRYGGQVWRVVRYAWGRKDDMGDMDMPGAEVQVIALVCGLLMFGVGSARLDSLWSAGIYVAEQCCGRWLIASVVVLGLLVVMGVQKMILGLSGALTFNGELVAALCARRMALFMTMTIVATPASVLMALSSDMPATVFAIAFLIVTIAHLAFYMVYSFLWFVRQKVSILFWILYLCAVEVMPLGILVTVLLRS